VAVSFERARTFVYENGRVLERRLFGRLFEDAGAEGVVAAVLAYRNEDGGFGHGLEPDKLAPDSQPLDVEIALERIHQAGAREPEIGRAACDFLETVADERGLVPIVLPSVARYPRANHWGEGQFPPSVGCTIAIAGYLHELGVEHPWLERATATCHAAVADEPLEDAHYIEDALVFARYAPGGEELIPRLAEALPQSSWLRADPDDESYGVPPTKFPREWFDDSLYEAHLDRLEREQADDGGWTLSWEPPGPGATLAWRAIVTIEALQTLEANGRFHR
jgi:hypothetical protein